jgi:hypothetical protein
MDARSEAALLLGTDTRDEGCRSTDVELRALSCEDDTGPSVVRRIVKASLAEQCEE